MDDFNAWWKNIGSAITPLDNDDMESHANRVSKAALSSFVGIDLAKPGTERCMRVWVDDEGEIKVEEIPIERIMKDVDQ